VLETNREFLRQQGYDIQTARRIQDARALVRQAPPDLILLDVMLPDGSGFDFCREIRAFTTAPVLYLTGRDLSGDVAQGLALGGDVYLTKPYDLLVLGAQVSALLRRAGVFTARVEVPPLVIDFVAGKATIGEEAVILSQKELQLLAYLAGHLGRRVGRDTLYEAVWGAPSNNAAHTVTEHIHRIRKKLRLEEEGSSFRILAENGEYMLSKVRY
jgi:DNA-binding response OmpR family regulator